jgi:hypothetical protein
MALSKLNISEVTTTVNSMPFIKEPLTFFQSTKVRLFLTIANSPEVWQNDLSLSEKMLAETIVCPYTNSMEEHSSALDVTKTVLKERMKYPNIKETPSLEKIAKTWIMPAKLHLGPNAKHFLQEDEMRIHTHLEPLFTALNTPATIQLLKVEVSGGQERQLLYKFLDSSFRPSLVLVKWSYDLDDHIPTANCAGHILNSGYSLFGLSNSYALYVFTEQTLYDLCSMKTISSKNPFLEAILESCTSVPASLEQNTDAVSSIVSIETNSSHITKEE